ncbi:MAG: ATP-binding protein, partial [Oscillospiraceae bacterium]
CKLYAEGFSLNSHSVLMIGNTGLGKTHLSSAIAKKVSQNGFSVMYVSYLDLVRNLQSEYFGKSDGNTMSKVLDADLLILDDLGVEFDSQFNISALYNIINSRTNKPTIINTNLTAAELEKKYSQRIVSRLLTLYKCLKFTGVDVRYLKLKNHEI